MHAIQVILILFCLFAAWRGLARVRRSVSSVARVSLWLLVWGAAIFVILQPQVTEQMARFLGVTRGVDVPIYLSIALLFFLMFQAFGKVEDVERQLTRVVREQALEEFARSLPPTDAPRA
jgi:small membrane protein